MGDIETEAIQIITYALHETAENKSECLLINYPIYSYPPILRQVSAVAYKWRRHESITNSLDSAEDFENQWPIAHGQAAPQYSSPLNSSNRAKS